MGDNNRRPSRRQFLAGAAGTGSLFVAGCTSGTESGASTTETTETSSGETTTTTTSGATTGSAESQPTLRTWLGVYTEDATKREYINNLVSRFEDRTGIKIDIQGVPYADFTTKLQAAAAGGSLPHLAEISANTGSLRFAKSINDLFEGSKTAKKTPESVVQFHKKWGSQIRGEVGPLLTWPLGLRPHIPTWRADWLESAGINREEVGPGAGSLHWYDDLESIYSQLKSAPIAQQGGNRYPSHTSMKQADEEFFVIYLAQFGAGLAGVVNETATASVLDTQEAYDAIRLQVEFMEKGYFHPNSVEWGDEESTTAQWDGRVAEIHNQDTADLWTSYLGNVPDLMRNNGFVWGLPFREKNSATLVKTPSIALMDGAFENQAEEDAAVQFLDFWAANEENAASNPQKLGFAPTSPDIIRSADFFGQSEMHTKFWRDSVATTLEESQFANISAVPSSAINYQIPRKMHQRIVANDWEIERAANRAAEEINKILAEKGNR